MAYQFHRPAEQDGVAPFFRRCGAPNAQLDYAGLHGLSPNVRYRVEWRRLYAVDRVAELSGGELGGLPVRLDTNCTSLLVRYEAL